MPCDSVTTQSVNLANAQPDLIAKAMGSLGWENVTVSGQTTAVHGRTVTARNAWTIVTWTQGQGVTVRGNNRSRNDQMVAELTKAYSRTAVTWAAERAGWTVKQTEPNKLTLSRRR